MDGILLQEFGQQWMRWLFDPYGQIAFRTHPEPGSFWAVLTRVIRFVLSSQSYSFLPLPGWWVWDNAFKQAKDKGHLSSMEQGASEESGDLYSTLGRLDGNPTHVGDIARYWTFVQFRRNTFVDMRPPSGGIPAAGFGDAPGVHLVSPPRIVPFRTAEVAAATDLNRGSATPPVPATPAGGDPPPGPGDALADVFTLKDETDPRDVRAGTGRLFASSALGHVPTSPKLERSVGVYVAFARPTQGDERHRITVDKIVDPDDARDAQDEGKQRIFFERQIADVAVKLAGDAVDEGSVKTLVATQQARLAVEPNGGRRYAVTVVEPHGARLGLMQGDEQVLEAHGTPTPAGDPEPVEVSRLHEFTPDPAHPRGGTFASPGLAERGLNLPLPVHVPVRRFSVEVVTTLPFRGTADGDLDPASVLASVRPGQHGFLVVPTAVTSGVRATSTIRV